MLLRKEKLIFGGIQLFQDLSRLGFFCFKVFLNLVPVKFAFNNKIMYYETMDRAISQKREKSMKRKKVRS